jgi:NTE family protein
LILRADPNSPAWTRACLSLTDMVLVVMDASAAVRLPDASLTRDDGSRLRRVELVLLHPPSTSMPRDTRRWLEQMVVDTHHHLRHGHRRDLARLCRRLTGDSVAVAFGGGAARGLAHLGVLRAFVELGVPIDLTCGTSFGSVVAALIAIEHDLAQITKELARYFSDYTLLRPAAVPLLSMLSGDRLESMCRELFGDIEVEDTWLPYFSIASNLGDACPELMTTGSVAFSVQASGSVPGLWPPVFRGSQVLVDGVITNNLPGDEIAKLHQGRTIAVNLIPRRDPLFSTEAVPRSRAKALLSRISPFQQSRQPLLPDLALRSLFMATVRHAESVRNDVDLFIEPDVAGFGFLLEAARREQIIEAGYRGAIAALENWRQTP